MEVRAIRDEDRDAWRAMRGRLWPDEDSEHEREIAAFFGRRCERPAAVFIAGDATGAALGFAEASLREFAEGCSSSPVAYLEGWFVERGARREGVGAALVRAVAEWGRAQGCRELASDSELHNTTSIKAHSALGFSEVGRVVCFRRSLVPPTTD